jgi:pyruvate/2-oxoglutarate dehydrogenase complex dihydrolipoamide dehydrogenase (E3) component
MHVDAVVIGAGQAGVPLAHRLAEAGREVVLVERSRVGGTCVNYGCTPTKTLVASARAAHVARTARRLGVEAGPVRVDFHAVMARKDAMVRRWREGLDRRLASAKERLRVVHGHARLVGDRTVDVAGQRYRSEVVVLNVGARPAAPPLEGIAAVPWLDNRRVMELDELPEHLVVLGGGYIGCEFAQMFRRFGSEVTVVQRGPHLLGREDPDISEALESVFRAEGIELVLGTGAARVSPAGGGRGVALELEGGRTVAGSHLLGAVGRRPNTDDLGCDAAGVRLDEDGFVVVDEQYRTTGKGIYAVGDAIGGPQFTHTSWDDHRILLDVLAGRPARGRSGRVVPHVVFTDPQVAGVGLNERRARDGGVPHEVARMPYGQVARAIEVDEMAGAMKVLVDPESERILGASLVGAEAGELVHVLAVLMQAGATARSLVDVELAHPTFAEGLQTVLMKLPRYALR